MPQHVRNFWVSVDCDARQRPVETGPRRANGDATIRILFREDGGIADRDVRIECQCFGDELRILAKTAAGELVTLATSKR